MESVTAIEGAYTADRKRRSNRGAYLANALAHWRVPYTKNIFGGLDYDRWMAGTANGQRWSDT